MGARHVGDICSAASRAAICCVCSLVALAKADAERLAIKTYTTADGLPSTFVQHIMQDSHGFLWFSTRDGLSRFDGYQFITYGTSDGLPVPTINFFLEGRDGTRWIATNGGGVCRFDPSTKLKPFGPNRADRLSSGTSAAPLVVRRNALFTCYPLSGPPPSARVNQLHEDRQGTLWAGTDGGLFRLALREGGRAFQQVPMKVIGFDKPDRTDQGLLDAINPLLEDREGSLWLGTGLGLVRRLPDGRMVHVKVRPHRGLDPVSSLLEHSDGTLWIGHADGLFVFQPEPARTAESARPGRSLTLAEHATVVSVDTPDDSLARAGKVRWYRGSGRVPPILYRSRDGSIWCAHAGRLLRFNGVRPESVLEDWDDAQFGPIAEDLHGNLWVAGRTGAFKLLLNGFSTFSERDGLPPGPVHSIFEDPAGRVVVVTGRWSLRIFDGSRFNSARLQVPNDIGATWASQIAFVDSSHHWWALTSTGLFRFPAEKRIDRLNDQRPLKRYTIQDGLATDSIVRLFEDTRGDIWIGTRSESLGGLSRWDRASGRIQRYLDSGDPIAREPTAFAEDRFGNLWVGFYEGGLARIHGDQVLLLDGDTGIPPGMITALHVDAANRLWIASARSGAARVDDPSGARPRFVSYTTSNGLGSDNVRCITEDLQGRVYFGTVRGVDRLDLTTGRVKQFTMADGLSNSFVSAAFRDRQGTLWFGTAYGVSRLVPRSDGVQPPPPVLISGLRVAGVQHPVSELGEMSMHVPDLTAEQNKVQFDFHGLGFAMGERLRYQYRLEGLETDWNPATDERSVTYASLAPRSYRFLVQAINAEAVPSSAPASVTFTILPPIWQRGWFLALTCALAGLMIAFVYRSRVTHLLALERVRMGIAADLHDDIGSNLSQIAILSEVARRQIEREGLVASQPLELIANLSRASVDSMSDIVWATNPEKDSAANLVTRMRNLANEVLAARGIDITFDTTGEPQARLDAQLRRQVFLIFKESLNNVVRHAGHTTVDIRLDVQPQVLVLSVIDHGKGFDTTAGGDGHGLTSMRGRAASLGGHIELASSPDGGTSLRLTVSRRHSRASDRRMPSRAT